MDATTLPSVDPADLIQVVRGSQVGLITAATLIAPALAANAALAARADALAERLAALEGKPEEVAHFGAVARLPNVAVGATFTVTLTGLAPARAGDILRAGETVEVRVVGDLPAGVAWRGPPSVPVDNTVTCTFTAALALSGAAPITFAITALR